MMMKNKNQGLNPIDFTNFHDMTRAEFRPAETPDREPDFVSPSGSVYWDAGTGVFRASDHWAGLNGCTGQASCVWTLLETVRPGVWFTAFCEYEGFKRRTWGPRQHRVSDADRDLASRILASGGALIDDHHRPAPVPTWAKVNLRGSAYADPLAKIAFDANLTARRAITAEARILAAIVAGDETIGFGRVLN